MADTNVAQLGPASAAVEPHRVLHRLMALLDISDTELARLLEVSRQTIHNRRKGRQKMSIDHIDSTASVLGVDPRLFLGTELEAIEWIIANRAELFRCLVA